MKKSKLNEVKKLVKELDEVLDGDVVRGAISPKQYEQVTGDKLINRKEGKEKEIVLL